MSIFSLCVCDTNFFPSPFGAFHIASLFHSRPVVGKFIQQQKKLKFMLTQFFRFSLSFAASRIRYEITSGNIGGAFAVKNMTGAIYVAGALDYETRKRVSTLRQKLPLIDNFLKEKFDIQGEGRLVKNLL
jgi:hypothetical protein